MNPLISIVIPIYNAGSYLKQCLTSIQKQTFSDFEVICVNDGSTDNSSKIIKEMSTIDVRFKLIERDSSSGSASLPRNIGIDNAVGKYIIFLDSDDYFDTHLLEKLYNQAKELNADMTVCDCWYVNHGNIEEHSYELNFEGVGVDDKAVFSFKDVSENIFQLFGCAIWNKLILKELIDKNSLRFQESVYVVDDVYFVTMLYVMAERISVINERLIYYRIMREGSQTNSIEKHYMSIFDCLYYLNNCLKGREFYPKIKSSLQYRMISLMRWWYLSVSDFEILEKLSERYRNECFAELGLLNIEFDEPNRYLKRFYNMIINNDTSSYFNNDLPCESRLIIYGAGYYGIQTYNKLISGGKYNIVLWVDKNADNIGNPNVVRPEKIMETEFDAVIVAITNDTTVEEVSYYLIDMGVDKKKILMLI